MPTPKAPKLLLLVFLLGACGTPPPDEESLTTTSPDGIRTLAAHAIAPSFATPSYRAQPLWVKFQGYSLDYNEEGPFPAPKAKFDVIGDTNNDGVSDLLFTIGAGAISKAVTVSGASGVQISSTDLKGGNASVLSDLDGDQVRELAIADTQGTKILNGKTRGLIWQTPNGARLVHAISDFSGDGIAEVLWSNGYTFGILGGGNTKQDLLPESGGTTGVTVEILSLGDLNGDGRPELGHIIQKSFQPDSFEIRSGSDGSEFSAFHPNTSRGCVVPMKDGSIILSDAGLGDFWTVSRVSLRDQKEIWSVQVPVDRETSVGIRCDAVPDVDANGTDEVAITGAGSGVALYNGTSGAKIWSRASSGNIVASGVVRNPKRQVIAYPQTNMYFDDVYLVDAQTGALLWWYRVTEAHVTGLAIVPDLNRDNADEVLIADTLGRTHAISTTVTFTEAL